MVIVTAILSLLIGFSCVKLALHFWHGSGWLNFFLRLVVGVIAVFSILLINMIGNFWISSAFAMFLLLGVLMLHKVFFERNKDVVSEL